MTKNKLIFFIFFFFFYIKIVNFGMHIIQKMMISDKQEKNEKYVELSEEQFLFLYVYDFRKFFPSFMKFTDNYDIYIYFFFNFFIFFLIFFQKIVIFKCI